MKVHTTHFDSAGMVRLAAALTAALVTIVLLSPAPAHAITRREVLKRANTWVRRHIGYSQHSYYRGYRKDCSGMVSMAWRLRTSLTSRTISTRAKRIAIGSLKPGDAVLTPGHVEIFARWASKRHRTFVALEQSRPGVGAVRRIKHIKGSSRALRYRGISERRHAAKKHPVAPRPDESTMPTASTTATATASRP